MAGGGAPAPKGDEPAPHIPKDQLPNVAYCITSPPPWRQCFLYCFFFFQYILYLSFQVGIKWLLIP